jgi:hypothetical protein
VAHHQQVIATCFRHAHDRLGRTAGFDPRGQLTRVRGGDALRGPGALLTLCYFIHGQNGQEVGRKQDRHEEQVDVVRRRAQRRDTKVHGGSVVGLIRWRC